jgi:hypothetical protein
MLAEALNFLATLAITPRRRSAEINASIRLWARARRCMRDWQAHEEHCHAVVATAVKGLPQRRVAIALGSGLLRDVPIELLSRQFDEVRLYDLQHLASVRLWAAMKGLRNLNFISRDLSESMQFLAEMPDVDLIVSANLLSQLGVNAVRHGINPAPIIRAHLAALENSASTACLLLTDIRYSIIGRDGALLDEGDLMHGVDIGAADASWDWTVAPFGELDPAYTAVHRVIARAIKPRQDDPEPGSP